jgi:hypothetical protein
LLKALSLSKGKAHKETIFGDRTVHAKRHPPGESIELRNLLLLCLFVGYPLIRLVLSKNLLSISHRNVTVASSNPLHFGGAHRRSERGEMQAKTRTK